MGFHERLFLFAACADWRYKSESKNEPDCTEELVKWHFCRFELAIFLNKRNG